MTPNNANSPAEFQEEQFERLESGFVLCRDLLTVTAYNESADSEGFFVIPSSGNNVIGRYCTLKDMEDSAPNIIVRRTVYNMLCEADKALKRKSGYETCQIVVTYGYRSPDIQKKLFDEHYQRKKEQYPEMTEEQLIEAAHIEMAYPEVAGHPTGGAVDVTVYDWQRNKFLEFGTEPGEFDSKNMYYGAESVSTTAKENRRVLRSIMCQQGFAPYDGEWWHFSYGDREWAFYMYRRSLREDSTTPPPVALYRQKEQSAMSEVAYNDKYKTNVHIVSDEPVVRMAVQKDGRLTEETLTLLQKSGINITVDKRGYLAKSSNFPIEILLVRDDDIPNLVDAGVADIGIVGENVYRENGCESVIRKYLGFGKCFLALAIPKNSDIKTISDLAGKRIATSYRRLTGQFLEEKGITDCRIIDISGSVEVAPVINYADAIVDLVSTGSSLRQNNLEVLFNILNSQSILIVNRTADADPVKSRIVDQLMQRMDCYLLAKKYKQISMMVPTDKLDAVVETVCPRKKSTPAVEPETDEAAESAEQCPYGIGVPYIRSVYGTQDYVGLSTVIQESRIWKIAEELGAMGVKNISFADIEGVIEF